MATNGTHAGTPPPPANGGRPALGPRRAGMAAVAVRIVAFTSTAFYWRRGAGGRGSGAARNARGPVTQRGARGLVGNCQHPAGGGVASRGYYVYVFVLGVSHEKQ